MSMHAAISSEAAVFACKISRGKKIVTLKSPNIRLAVQTALAGVAASYFSQFLRLPEGYWAAITAVIVMQANLGAALKQSWIRIAATAIGVVVAIPLIILLGKNLLAFGLAVLLTVIICSILHLDDGLRIAAATVAIIILIPRAGRPWNPAIDRFLEVSFGIVMAILVTNFVWPASAQGKLRKELASCYLQLRSLFVALMQRYEGDSRTDVDQLRSELNAMQRSRQDLQDQVRYEKFFRSGIPPPLAKLIQYQERIARAIDALDVATKDSQGYQLALQMNPEMDELRAGIDSALVEISEKLSNERVVTEVFDFEGALKALDAKAQKLRTDGVLTSRPLQEILSWGTVCLALKSLAGEVQAAQTITPPRDEKN
jgi:uncharacterized membrane protein YccC